MSLRSDIKFRWLHETIRSEFDFLFERGFGIASVMLDGQHAENWQVMLFSEDQVIVRLRCDEGQITLGVSTEQLYNRLGFFDLGVLLMLLISRSDLYELPNLAAMDEKRQIEEIARLLEKYFEKILVQFDKMDILPSEHFNLVSELNNSGQLSNDN